ncbi:MAG: TetR/AcrR family transcriptional regulator [Deltaproteobacteria bacterium]|nr:TetR/AcrR family transcriptional regulator [Deltaproteobacteria bacterium]
MTNGHENKKQVILASATKIFAEKGFADATISEIAKGAGLTSSGIYLYYKNKEALLFTVIENFMIESNAGLTEHLQGIRGAENKLRKAIWYHCKSYSISKKVIKIILEARSYPRFYKSSAYTALKQYARIINDIIAEGMQAGVFCGVSSPMILRDMILGTVDHIAINWTMKDVPDSSDHAEKIYDLVMRAVQPAPKDKNRLAKKLANKAEKRVRIINSATALFTEKGFNDTSMLEIAQKADVAEGTVYEYFRNKENLLISIPHEKLTRLYDTVSGNSLEIKLKSVITSIFEFYYNEKDYSTILVLMLRTNKKFHNSESNEIIEKLFTIIEEIIVTGQGQYFKANLDLNLCRDLLFGTLDHIMIPWIIFDRRYDWKALGAEVSDLFVNAIRV